MTYGPLGENKTVLEGTRRVAAFLVSTEIWVVGGAIGASVLSERFLPLAVVVAAAFWPLRWIAERRLSVRTPVDGLIVLLLLMIGITLTITVWPTITLPQVYRLLTGLGLFYAIVNWTTTSRRLRLIVFAAVLLGLALAISALFSVNWLTNKLVFIPVSIYAYLTPRITDTVNPAVMAGSLVILLPLTVALFVCGGTPFGRLGRSLVALVGLSMAVVLVLTQARGALLASAAMLVAVVLLRWPRSWLALLPLSVVVGFVISRFGFVPLLGQLTTGNALRGLPERIEIWSRAVYLIEDFRFTGIGMGAFEQVVDHLYPYLINGDAIPHAHNLFLQIAVDLGVPGVIAWLAIVVLVTMASWRVYHYGRKTRDNWIQGVGIGLLGSQVGLLVNGLTDAVTWGMVRTAVIPWALWAIAIASARLYVPHRAHTALLTEVDGAAVPDCTSPTQL